MFYRGIVKDELRTLEDKVTKPYQTYFDAHEAAEKLCKDTYGERGEIDVIVNAIIDDEELAKLILDTNEYDLDLLKELCKRADMLDEWEAADGETFEAVALEAAKKLGVEIQ